MRILSWTLGVFTAVFLLAGTALAQEKPADQLYSGFLGNAYADLRDVESPSGKPVKRWLSPELTPGKYDSVLLERNVFQPRPRGSVQLSSQTLDQISAYFDEALQRELGSVVKLTRKAGPRTLRLRTAITAIAAKDTGLKPYQLIPIAFIATAGASSKGAHLAVEFEATDMGTGKLMAAGMRDAAGLELENRDDKLRLQHFKPLIDAWARDARTFIDAAQIVK